MDFSAALLELKAYKKLTRTGWNGKGMHVCLVSGGINFGPYFCMVKPDGFTQPGWVPSIGDLTADDWELVE